jgi:1A family penicillin-binding protein
MPLLKLFRHLLVLIGYPVFLLCKTIIRFFYPNQSLSLRKLLKSIYPFIVFSSSLQLPKFNFKFIPRLTLGVPSFKTIAKLGLSITVLIVCMAVFAYFYVFQDLPAVSSLTLQPIPQTTHIRDRRGVELYKVYRNENRTLVHLQDLPIYLQQATIAIEDKEFYAHPGFSLTGISRAVWRNLVYKENQGGSTITQQLVKTALLSPEKTLQRKLRELVLSIGVEMTYTKEQILEMYLNRVSFGGAAYGIEEAAKTYFGKSSTQLSLSEAALLVGLPASPTTYSPFGTHPELAKARQKEVLKRMVEDGYLSWEEAEAASAKELQFVPQRIDIKAPHFVMYIKEILAEKYGVDAVEQGGLDVITSLDLSIQETAEKIVATEVAKVKHLKIGNGAALVTNPQTGEILAMVGSKDYFDLANDGNVNVTARPRQPGSSIKPINYALALMRGFTPASLIEDTPVRYSTAGQPTYSPVNYDGRFHGKVSLRTALASSYNVTAVKLLAANGVPAMIDLARKMGISTWEDESRFGLSLTLGGGEVTMLEMAEAYGVFANYGSRVELQPILTVKDSQGRNLEEFHCNDRDSRKLGHNQSTVYAAEAAATEIISCESEKVMDAKVAFLISDILSDNTARTPAFGSSSDLFIPGYQVAVKTGTTNNLRDNWTIGYTPDRLVAVWVGNNDNTSMSYVASGVTGASPIWRKIMDSLLKGRSVAGFAIPADLVSLKICTITGELACGSCPSRTEYFLPGTEPKRSCSDESIKRLVEERRKKDEKERDTILNGISINL